MMIKKIILFILLALPIHAANTDDEIIKNLDFFQNLELIKDDNPFLIQNIAKDNDKPGSEVKKAIEKEIRK